MPPKRNKTEKIKLSKETVKNAKGIFSYLKPYSLLFGIGWVFLALSSSAGVIFPYFMGQLLAGGNQQNVLEIGNMTIDMSNVNHVALILLILFSFAYFFKLFHCLKNIY